MTELIETERLYVEELQSIIEVQYGGSGLVASSKHPQTHSTRFELSVHLMVSASAEGLGIRF